MVGGAEDHTPVLLPEVLAALNVRASGIYLDATFGRGGHAGAILEKLTLNGRLLCLDRDSVAIAEARTRFASDPRVAIFLAPFSALGACADRVRPGLKFDGILFDLGVSSPQLDDPSRGFSFIKDGPLDMRMSKGEGLSAADVVNGASEAELIRIFREFGEERYATRIARAIVTDRAARPFERTSQLAGLIERVARAPRGAARTKHPATRVFQALGSMSIGSSTELQAALDVALERLEPQRTARRHQLSLARGSHGETIHAPPFAHRPDVRRLARNPGARAAEAQARRQVHRAAGGRNRAQSARPQRPPARRRAPGPEGVAA